MGHWLPVSAAEEAFGGGEKDEFLLKIKYILCFKRCLCMGERGKVPLRVMQMSVHDNTG